MASWVFFLVYFSILLCTFEVLRVTSTGVLEKRALLSAISKSRRLTDISTSRTQHNEEILERVRTLEALNCGRDANIEGNWNLVWSGSSGALSPRESVPALQFFSDRLYSIFFKFAPQLAGSSNSNNLSTRNEQFINLSKGTIRNKVEIKSFIPVTIIVEGSCKVRDDGDQAVVDVVFTKSTINGVVLPLPNPKGTLKTAFNDGDLRITIGGQGGVFVCQKM